MLSLKPLGAACALGASFMMGCTTHSTNLNSPMPPTHTTQLQSHHWQLQQALSPQGTPDTRWRIPAADGNTNTERLLGLRFSQKQTIHVDRLCNSIHGSYNTQGERITIGHLASTMMACPDSALMQLEQNVAQQLSKARTWQITNGATPSLELQFEGGATWKFKGTPTHETLYGNSQRIFLEIAPHKVACHHPLIANAQCLRVREVSYSDQGIKQSVGEWFSYYGTIEGYEHQAGVRNILRIKRYARESVPADASKYVDVLDITVESESVR